MNAWAARAARWSSTCRSGEGGWTRIRIEAGDVIVMPAGVSHEDVGHSDDIMMCGGYADGRDWDNIQEAFLTPDLYYQACKIIMSLPIPNRDPVTGSLCTNGMTRRRRSTEAGTTGGTDSTHRADPVT